jgi:hypothetical protein
MKVIKKMEDRGKCNPTCVEEKRNVYRILVGKTEGKKPRGRTWFRCEENIKMN